MLARTAVKPILVLVVALACAAVGATPASADYLKRELAGGIGNAITSDGAGGHYVGGSFTRWNADNTGGGLVLKNMDYTGGSPTSSGTLDRAYRMFDGGIGSIRAVLADGSGGWYVGGTFTRYGLTKTNNLAHINADGTLDTGFAANIPFIGWGTCGGGGVQALALSGGTLYVGGLFDTVNGTARPDLAAVDATTGALKPFNANVGRDSGWNGCGATSGRSGVDAILVDGSNVFFGGSFPSVAGLTTAADLAKVDATTGASDATFNGPAALLTASSFGFSENITVASLAKVGSDLWVGSNAGSGTYGTGLTYYTSRALAVISPVNKAVDATKTNAVKVTVTGSTSATLVVNSIVPDGADGVYVGGAFAAVGSGSLARAGLARFKLSTQTYDSGFDAGLGGTATGCGSVGTGALSWGAPVEVIGISLVGDSVLMAGRFNTVGGVARAGIAAVSNSTGGLDGDFDVPLTSALLNGGCNSSSNGNGVPNAIVKAPDGSLFIGGYFDSHGGTPVGSVIHVNPNGTRDTAFNATVVASSLPILNCTGVCTSGVRSMVKVGDRLYIGGAFDSVGGNTSLKAAAILKTSDGSLASRQFFGTFNQASTGVSNSGLVPATTVLDIEVDGSTIWFSGAFEYSEGSAKTVNIVGIDSATDRKTAFTTSPWTGGSSSGGGGGSSSTVPAPVISSIAVKNGKVFASAANPRGYTGSTSDLSGADGPQGGNLTRFGLFAMDASTGALVSGALGQGILLASCSTPPGGGTPTCWDTYGGTVAISGNRLFVGGNFNRATTTTTVRKGLAEFDMTSGSLKSFDPGVTGRTECGGDCFNIQTLVADGSSLFVGGFFQTIGGKSRGGIAQIDTTTDAVTSFDPLDGSSFYAPVLYVDPLDGKLYTSGIRYFPDDTNYPTVGLIGEPTLKYSKTPILSQTSWGYMVTVNYRPPSAPAITSPTGSSSNANSIVFEINDGNTAECQVDGGAWTACTSPLNISGLAEGAHTFAVRQTDAQNRTSSASNLSWTIDRTAPAAPTVTMVSPTLNGSGATSTTSAQFTFTVPSGASKVQCQIDGGTWADCTSPKNLSGLADGQHTLKFRAVDDAGNTSSETSKTWGVYSAPPAAPTVTSPTGGSSNANSVVFTQIAGLTYTCEVDGGTPVACTSPFSISGLSQGSHTVKVRAVDPLGNTGSPTTVTWIRDTVAPAAPTVTSKPSATTTSTTASIGFTGSGQSGATFQCKVDAAAWAPCLGNPIALSALTLGGHTVLVREVDAAGNQSAPATVTWTIQQAQTGDPCMPRPTPPTPGKTVKLTKVNMRWTMNAGAVFNSGGDTRGCAQLLTVQVSTEKTKPVNDQPGPLVPNYANGVLAWTGGSVSRQSHATPKWIRVENRIGRWSGWIAIKP